MELRSLKYFQSVYEQGSISGAARVCFVSQPSITTAIQQLESDLNITLFFRHARGVLPTDAADKLYPKAKEMADNAKSISHLFSENPKPVLLRLGIMRSLGAQRMSHLLKKITEKIDHLELTLVDPQEPCDARVVSANSVAYNESFIPIWQDNYQIAVPKSWPIAQQSSINIIQLQDMPFINRAPCDALDTLKVVMADASIRFQPRANIKTIEYAWQLVCAGIGAALLPDWQEILEAEALALMPVEDNRLIKDIGLAFNRNKENSLIISAVKEVCRSVRVS
ncbi:LysR family transcriptional regulator [Colwellia sp. Bg11-12]|jgi:DNA-binding transcriptional LysR family regulator|uniref:LysR family transcriptional regulator n=1 Tax=Colwellia sp. Bg11-12 TaxID=2759817 RepID=UPI0015F684DF|nr:LysR family transcriptional regulator [Colwellia sp. Bg11-12]MBA6262686.1 LysR family transcriptional regulator [Colwellia sp. Bg11-12]